jgi:hypothetical protein
VIDRRAGRGFRQRRAIESTLQDRSHRFEARAPDQNSTRARGVDALMLITIGKTDDPEARSISGLRMGTTTHDRSGEHAHVLPDACGPSDDALGWPLAILAMRARSVLLGNRRHAFRSVVTDMARNAHSLMQDLDHARRRADLDGRTD